MKSKRVLPGQIWQDLDPAKHSRIRTVVRIKGQQVEMDGYPPLKMNLQDMHFEDPHVSQKRVGGCFLKQAF